MEANTVIPVRLSPEIQPFSPGDTVRVGMRVKEGDRERVQVFQGLVIRLKGKAPGTTLTVRRVSYGIGIERTFPLYSPLLEKVEVVRRGDVRQANLYYLRGRQGRAARIKERAWTRKREQPSPETVTQERAEAGQEE